MARLTKKQKYIAAGVGGAALLGTIGYFAYKSRSASAVQAPPASGCWQPLSGPFTLVPGHYRIEMAAPPPSDPSASTAWTQMLSAVAVLQKALPAFVVEGIWYGSYAYPKGTPLPTDWPTAGVNALRMQFSNAYSDAGTTSAGKAIPQGLTLWMCSTGPTPAQQPLPTDLATLLAQAAQAAQGTAGGVMKSGGGLVLGKTLWQPPTQAPGVFQGGPGLLLGQGGGYQGGGQPVNPVFGA